MNGGEYTDCGCGMWMCKRYYTLYVDMPYNRLLRMATERGYISHKEMPTFEKVVYLLTINNKTVKDTS